QYAENEKILPSFIEKEFNFMLDRDRITGRWDRVDVVDGKVSIIDYKSSPVKDKKKADKKAKESLQLAIYALAYYKVFGKIPDSLKLHFLETGIVGETSFTLDDFEVVIEKIKQASRGIRERLFDPSPSYFACRFCPYQGICPCEESKKYVW
ncbi:PD-(D/E)XK nuclease family protein, partial [Candidatus Aerophobetes bacterium]|nr:PD-(D/E)XK nuclease family protein [Candidatus Aerophobetes bacterium]